eukprot:jgi/Chrzof1/2448/Cz11g16050.t1_FDX6[v5.2]
MMLRTCAYRTALPQGGNCGIMHQAMRPKTCRICTPHRHLQQCRSGSQQAPCVTIYFKQEDVATEAHPGDSLLEVADACGVSIPTGCFSGSCGICEVEVTKFKGSSLPGDDSPPAPAVIRACIAKIPPGYDRLEIDQLQDAIWGLDGYDT